MTEEFVARRISRIVTVLASIVLMLVIGWGFARAQTPSPQAQVNRSGKSTDDACHATG